MATIRDHLSVEELDARLRDASDVTEIKHIQAIRLLAKGHTFVETADILAFVPRWVEELAQRYNALGPQALGDGRRRNGRKPTVLTAEVLQALSERVQTPPADGGLWSGPKVALWLAQTLGREHVHPQRGWDALKKIGWSIQVPRPRNPQAGTAEAREAFKKSSKTPSPKKRAPIPTSRSKSGRRMSIASA
jgi:transposase